MYTYGWGLTIKICNIHNRWIKYLWAKINIHDWHVQHSIKQLHVTSCTLILSAVVSY